MGLEDFGLSESDLGEAIAPEGAEPSVRDMLGLASPGDLTYGADDPSYAEIIAAGLETTGIDPLSPRGAALVDWAAQTDRDATARGD